jgi:hypothetical protein
MEQRQEQLKQYVSEAPLDEALGMIVMELQQYIGWVIVCQAIVKLNASGKEEAVDRILILLDEMRSQVVDRLIIETLLPRLEQARSQDPASHQNLDQDRDFS